MYIQTKDLTASRVLSGHKIAPRCHIFDLETFKNANLVCTWCMCSVYQSYTRFLSYIPLFLVYSWYIAVISNIPGVFSRLPIVVIRFIAFSLKLPFDRFVLAILIFNLSLESLFLFAILIADLSPVSLFLFAMLIFILSLVSLFLFVILIADLSSVSLFFTCDVDFYFITRLATFTCDIDIFLSLVLLFKDGIALFRLG